MPTESTPAMDRMWLMWPDDDDDDVGDDDNDDDDDNVGDDDENDDVIFTLSKWKHSNTSCLIPISYVTAEKILIWWYASDYSLEQASKKVSCLFSFINIIGFLFNILCI